MLTNIWKHNYKLRRYSEQIVVDGYPVRSYQDYEVMLDVQPEVDSVVPTESGKRVTERLVSYGNFPCRVENVREGINADRIFYEGNWYECESSMWYQHLPISHYTARWVRVTEALNEAELVGAIEYDIEVKCTDGTYVGAEKIDKYGLASVKFTASEGYVLPSTVSVQNAVGIWNKSTGVLSLSNPRGKVSVNIICEQMPSTSDENTDDNQGG